MNREEHPFVKHLERLRESGNRAALAKLRRGWGKRMGTSEMYPYVVPFLPENPFEHARYFLVASLFGLHPGSGNGCSIGTAFRIMRKDSDSIEKRFMALLNAAEADIGGHLRQAVSLSRSRKIALDYHRLLKDLACWGHPDRFIQLRWARDFWGSGSAEGNMEMKTELKGEME